jgi:hypothetical protein
MTRHPFDPISLIFGMLFSAAGLWVLLTDADARFLDARWTWPVLLLAAGFALIASVLSPRGRTTLAEEPTPEPTAPSDTSDWAP